MGTRETTMDERRRLALGLAPDEDPEEALDTAPEDSSTDNQPIGGNEDPVPDPEGARSENAGLPDGEESDEEDAPAKPAKRGRKAKDSE